MKQEYQKRMKSLCDGFEQTLNVMMNDQILNTMKGEKISRQFMGQRVSEILIEVLRSE